MIGQLLGGYRVVEQIGQGPNGTVWLAEHPDLKNQVAIKILPGDLARSPADRERFERGSRAAARLSHSAIATVFAAEFAGDTPYIISEFVDGQTVNALVAAGPVPPRQAIDIVLQAAKGLDHAHQQGVIHRDISGGNVMVTGSGQCKLVDFGIAVERDATRKTTQGTVLGTWPYMAPEALRDEAVTGDRDTYALGVVLYQLLTGHTPFEAETFEALVYRILNEDARPPSVHVPSLPAELDRLVLRVLEKSPRHRLTMSGLIAELEALRTSGVLEGDRRPRRSLWSRIGQWRLLRPLLTMAPSQTRRLATMASVSIVSIGLLGWLVARALPQGPVRPKVASLAIIPLFNESREQGFEYIGHGLAEHLADRLDGLEGLLVQPYRKWVAGDAAELCGQLKVEGVLEGSFAIEGGVVETRVDLVKADGTREPISHAKSEGYKRAAEQLAMGVARGLKSRLTVEEATQVALPGAGSNEAFDALSTAVDAQQRDERDAALRWYERAASLDPGLARAYVGIGSIYYDRYFRGAAGPQNLDIAKLNFRQALALEPDNSGAERGLILVHFDRDERDSGLVIARAAAQRPQDLATLMIQAWAYALNPVPDLAIPILNRVIEQDPLNDEAYWLLVLATAWAGQFERTVSAGETYLSRFGEDPEVHFWVAHASWRLGRATPAREHYRLALDLFDERRVGVSCHTAQFFLEAGDPTEARAILISGLKAADQLCQIAPDNPRLRMDRAVIHMALGNRSKALIDYEHVQHSRREGQLLNGVLDGYWHLWWHADRQDRNRIAREMALPRYSGDVTNTLTSRILADALEDPLARAVLVSKRAQDDSLRRHYGLPANPSRF